MKATKFIQIGNAYAALHFDTNTVFLVNDTPDDYKAQVIHSDYEPEYMETYTTAVEITEELFRDKFSEIVSKLQNNTPYAKN